MTEKEIKEYVTEIRHKADIFRKSGFATAGFATHFDKSADIIEELLEYKAIGTIDEFKALKEKSVETLLKDGQLLYQQGLVDGYAKAIDEFAETLNKKISEFVLEHKDNLDFASGISVAWNMVDEIAEQMKGGGK